MARLDELRLMTRVARLYHGAGLRQPAIARRLSLSQSTISRLLQRAQREGIVRVTVTPPRGVFPDVEEALQRRYALREAIVVDSFADDEDTVMRDLGAACAHYVETTVGPADVLGVDSYASLRSMVDALRPTGGTAGVRVVQLAGGTGDPGGEEHHAHLTRRLAALLRGEAVSLPAPGLAPSAVARRVFGADPFVRQATALFETVTLALLGIGAIVQPPYAGLLGACSAAELAALTGAGAAGFVCHRFFDRSGAPLTTPLDDRITAIGREELWRIPRRVGVSGGVRRQEAIRAALAGGWVNVLITDRFTAARLLQPSAGHPADAPASGAGVATPQGEIDAAVPQVQVRL